VNEPRDDAEDLAIARALGIEEGTDDIALDEDAVHEYREVLAHMPFDEVAPPAGLEDQVLAAAHATRSGDAIDLESRRARQRARSRVALLVAAAAAIIVVIGVVAATRDTSPTKPSATVREVGNARADVDALLKQPGARTATFTGVPGRAVLAPDGHGALYDLNTDGPIEVVLDTSGGNVSLGTTQAHDGVITFAVNHPDLVRGVTLDNPPGFAIGGGTFSR
jgi:hypothetical protein